MQNDWFKTCYELREALIQLRKATARIEDDEELDAAKAFTDATLAKWFGPHDPPVKSK